MMRRSSGMMGSRMLRSVGRSVAAGVKEKLSTAKGAKSSRVVSVSSPPASPTTIKRGSLSCFCGEDDEWETVGGDEGLGFGERVVFGPAPTEEEAEEAVDTIQQIFLPLTFSDVEVEYSSSVDEDVVDKVVTSTDVIQSNWSIESESDWIEPALDLYSSNSSQRYGHEHILDAVHMFQINPPFKRMVKALASDPAVWDAVMKNDVVQELKKSFYEAESSSQLQSPDGNDDTPAGILRWIMDSTKGKLTEFFEKISKLVNEIFHSPAKEESEPFDEFVRSSFMLSVVIFIVVVMTRIEKA
ncbi:uncharacterized protein A4U43_C10F8140 [Asparagus officinalis]|uniref:Uncharacterized protein n=1 Tax=Asparagus officinalis TaxID=4686 RepID=A0A5P1E1U5_ASPOF|nr:uncharacterized protein LOC109826088 [Asparagus officinalis]ONK56399.1 uncharacterized protein A4U43_C10F8140 [Asparagus officinalis]